METIIQIRKKQFFKKDVIFLLMEGGIQFLKVTLFRLMKTDLELSLC